MTLEEAKSFQELAVEEDRIYPFRGTCQEVKVSFVLDDSDWCLIQNSTPWKRILNFVRESRSAGNQMSLKEKVDLLEMP